MANKTSIDYSGAISIRKEGVYNLLLDSTINLTEKAFLFILLIFSGVDGTIEIKSRDLLTIIGCAKETFWKTLKRLREKNIIFFETTPKDPTGILNIQIKDYQYYISSGKRGKSIAAQEAVINNNTNHIELAYQRKYLLNGQKEKIFKEIKGAFVKRTGKTLSDDIVKQFLEKSLYPDLIGYVKKLNFSKYNGDPIGALCGCIKNPEAYEFISEEEILKQKKEDVNVFKWWNRIFN